MLSKDSFFFIWFFECELLGFGKVDFSGKFMRGVKNIIEVLCLVNYLYDL